jgi:RHS repeat-associated protein
LESFHVHGREYVSQFGIYEYRNRAYHPGLGRFISEDPKLFDAGDNNFFRYCGNDPIDKTDPMGLDPMKIDDRTDQLDRQLGEKLLNISEHNTDKAGPGLERGQTVGVSKDGPKASDKVAVGHFTGNRNNQQIQPPKQPPGTQPKVFVHNHTHDTKRDRFGRESKHGTVTSPGDKNNTGDKGGVVVHTTYRDRTTEQVIHERYRPSDDPKLREQHKDSVTEQFNPLTGTWKEIGN